MSAVLRAKIAAIIIKNFIFELLCFLEYFYISIKLFLGTLDFLSDYILDFMLMRARLFYLLTALPPSSRTFPLGGWPIE